MLNATVGLMYVSHQSYKYHSKFLMISVVYWISMPTWSLLNNLCKFHNSCPLNNVHKNRINVLQQNTFIKNNSFSLVLSCQNCSWYSMHFAASSFINCSGELFSLHLQYTTIHPLTHRECVCVCVSFICTHIKGDTYILKHRHRVHLTLHLTLFECFNLERHNMKHIQIDLQISKIHK